jgi:hypothetical protein
MKRILGQLSREFHKGGTPLVKLLPQIREAFNQILSDPPKDAKDCLNMIINMITSDTNFTEDVYEWASSNNYLTEQICTAMVASVAISDLEQAVQLIEKMSIAPHVRTFIPIFVGHEFSLEQFNRIVTQITRHNVTPTTELFSFLIGNAPKGSDILRLIKWSAQHCNNLESIVALSPSFATSVVSQIEDGVTTGCCQSCQKPIEIVHLTEVQREIMLASVFEKTADPSIVRWVKTRDYDIVIDGANVAHYNNSPFDSRKLITMIDKINSAYKYPKILLIFSISRKKMTKDLIIRWKNVDLFYTQSGTNDDLSWLYAGIYYPNIWCITNDQMRDHVYYKFTNAVGRNVVDLWMERNIVTYRFDITKAKNYINVQVSLDIPLPYSIRPQVNDKSVHIPIKDGWCCSTL